MLINSPQIRKSRPDSTVAMGYVLLFIFNLLIQSSTVYVTHCTDAVHICYNLQS